MTQTDGRLEQFRKMAEADPTNELAHFSLGKAYLDAGMDEPAVASFLRVVELNPNISKVYQMLASAQRRLGQNDAAMATLVKGVTIAHERGDMMPRNEMAKMIRDLGGTPPEFAATQAVAVGEGEVLCQRCGKVGPKIARSPFKGHKGQEIVDKICSTCWREWIPMGTKVINELRLPLSDPMAQKMYDQHMMEFLTLR
jgi:Fe-S cluster biosynthesis and repair protein YggX